MTESTRGWVDLGKPVDELKDTEDDLATEQEGQDEVQATISARTNEVRQIESEISRADSQIAEIQGQVDALQRELDSLGVTPDTLLEEKDALEKAIVVANEEAETLKGEIDLTRNVVSNNRQAMTAIRKRLADRKAAIGARQLTVQVNEVNDEFGFVVLSAGKNNGVSGDAQFLIQRGGALVAKVAASSVQNSITIANVIPGSMADGAVIMAGDRAILDAK